MWLTGSMYAVGAAIGLGIARSPLRGAHWPVAIRVQILIAACVLGVVAAWRLHTARQLEVPLGIEAVLVCGLVAALMTRGSGSRGEASLWSWAATANSAFWAVPLATALAGADGAVPAVLADRAAAPRTAYATHLLRADAPYPQRRRTAWVDQAPLAALLAGLLGPGVHARADGVVVRLPQWWRAGGRHLGLARRTGRLGPRGCRPLNERRTRRLSRRPGRRAVPWCARGMGAGHPLRTAPPTRPSLLRRTEP
jgi:hypothetical protein